MSTVWLFQGCQLVVDFDRSKLVDDGGVDARMDPPSLTTTGNRASGRPETGADGR